MNYATPIGLYNYHHQQGGVGPNFSYNYFAYNGLRSAGPQQHCGVPVAFLPPSLPYVPPQSSQSVSLSAGWTLIPPSYRTDVFGANGGVLPVVGVPTSSRRIANVTDSISGTPPTSGVPSRSGGVGADRGGGVYGHNDIMTPMTMDTTMSTRHHYHGNGDGVNFRDQFRSKLPCNQQAARGSDWGYDSPFEYYADDCYNSCEFVEMGDMEDFMNNEKRKEKSRFAARCRRSRETEIFTDLGNALPLTTEQVSQLDKASVMRLAISYLRVRDMIQILPPIPAGKEDEKPVKLLHDHDSCFLKSLEGFVLVLSLDGDFIFVSDNIADYLGISQMDLLGQNVYEFSHPCDHEEIKDILSAKSHDNDDDQVSFFMRMKCTLTPKGRSVNLKSASYKVIHCTGHLTSLQDDLPKDSTNLPLGKYFVSIGQPIPHPANIEAPLPNETFLTKHGLDMKITYADDKMFEFLGYKSDDLVGKSVFDYHHAIDSDAISTAFKCLFSKGQTETTRYRFLAKTGGYAWVATQATIINDKLNKPNSVVCVNYIISGIECPDEIYAAFQLEHQQQEAAVAEEETLRVTVTINAEDVTSSPPLTCAAVAALPDAELYFPSPVASLSSSGYDSDTLPLLSPGDRRIVAYLDGSTNDAKDNEDDEQLKNGEEINELTVVTDPTTTTITTTTEAVTIAASPPPSAPQSPTATRARPTCVTSQLFVPLNTSSSSKSTTAISAAPKRPETATAKVFAPRTDDMSKGFLIFSDDEPGCTTVVKDDPEGLDLTHLAPVAGDVCVPLEQSAHYVDMSLDILDFCPITDPFLNTDYHSPHLLSPLIAKKLEPSIHSLNSPGDSSLATDDDQTMSYLQFMDEDTGDLFRPSTLDLDSSADDQQLPLLAADEMLWASGNNSSVGGGGGLITTVTDFACSTGKLARVRDGGGGGGTTTGSSSLAELLQAGVTKGTGGGSQPQELLHLERSGKALSHGSFEHSSWRPFSTTSSASSATVNGSGKWLPAATATSKSDAKRSSSANGASPNANRNISASSANNKRLCNSRYSLANKRSKNDDRSDTAPTAAQQLDTSASRDGSATRLEHLAPDLTSTVTTPQRKQSPQQQQLRPRGRPRGSTKAAAAATNAMSFAAAAHSWLGKAACVSQPSDSVLMNLLDQQLINCPRKKEPPLNAESHYCSEQISNVLNNAHPVQNTICGVRKTSISLLEPEAAISSLLDLTQQDYDVNAPVNALLLQGEDLLNALEINQVVI